MRSRAWETAPLRSRLGSKRLGSKRLGSKRRGIAAVEFALVSVPLFLLMIGLIDYGLIFLKAQQITQAARAGARAAVVADATNASVTATIDAWMAQADIDTFSFDLTPDDVTTVTPGAPVKVEITVPTSQFNLVFTTGVVAVPIPTNLVAAASMAKEGP